MFAIELSGADTPDIHTRPDVALGRETWQSFWPEARPLGQQHFDELKCDAHGRRPFDLDPDVLRPMCERGLNLIYTGRLDGVLHAYIMWQPHYDPESRGLKIANMGPWFADPASRLGVKLFLYSLADLKRRGVKMVFPHHHFEGRSAKLGKFFQSLGAEPLKNEYQLWIGD